MTNDELVQKILDFMTVIQECFSHTNFADDRSVYAQDLVAAMSWVVELRGGGDIGSVKAQILSPETGKRFGDYWRQGDWGNKEAHALKKLRESLDLR
ncbi:MAG: hypothetical protein O3A59_14575 [Nitrospirae bacterium]|nr:hypothetical protein [Nitrospirota bacterium]